MKILWRKFSLRVFQVNVSPLASSILNHLLGRSSSIVGNKCGHVHSSWYLRRFHSFWHRSTCFVGSSPGWNLMICTWAFNFCPPNLSMKYVEADVQLCSQFWWVPHHHVAWPVKDLTRLWRQPWSPIFLVTSLRCYVGDSISLNLNFEFVVLFGIKVGYSLIFFSITLGTMDIE